MHRDLLWRNVACDPSKQHFYLLDLELVSPMGIEPGFELTAWGDDTLVNGRYTQQSDLHMLGKMMSEVSNIIQSQPAREFLEILTQPVVKKSRLLASTLLNHEWIACQGVSCRVAGAQPSQ